MEWLVDVLPLVARVCLVVIFPFSCLDKILNWDNALKQAESSFLPGGPVLLVLAMIVEVVTPVCIVSGWYDGLAAFVLAGYCVITAILYHNFWKYPRFWSPDSAGYPHLWDFLKNFGLVGGLIFIILGSEPVRAIALAASDIPVASVAQVARPRVGTRGHGPTDVREQRTLYWHVWADVGATRQTRCEIFPDNREFQMQIQCDRPDGSRVVKFRCD